MRGHLTKRGKNSWSIILDLPRDPATGKRRQQWHTVKGTKKQADAKLAELLHQIDSGGYVKSAKLTVGALLEQWLRNYVETNVRPRTIEGYRDIVRVHLMPKLGQIPFAQLSGSHLQEYYANALKCGRADGKGGLSARSVMHHHRVIRQALGHAVKWQLVQRNVALTVDPPRPGRVEMKYLDEEGLDRLLETARRTIYFPVLHLAAYTGMRRSELLGLRWGDVDLDMATLSVVQVMHRVRGAGFVFQPPKTPRSRRQVALTPDSAIALRGHREQQETLRTLLGNPLKDTDLVFCHLDGRPWRPDTVTHAFADLVKRAGLPHIRLHDLRHTHATLMMEQGTNPKVVSERLGHASVAITLDTYSHVTPGLQEAAALRFDEALARKRATKELAPTLG